VPALQLAGLCHYWQPPVSSTIPAELRGFRTGYPFIWIHVYGPTSLIAASTQRPIPLGPMLLDDASPMPSDHDGAWLPPPLDTGPPAG
jgi:hypothetical protein